MTLSNREKSWLLNTFKCSKQPIKKIAWQLGIGQREARQMINTAIGVRTGPHVQTTVKKQVAGILQDASLNRGKSRGGQDLGDKTIFSIIPYTSTVEDMKQDVNFRLECITALNNLYENVRNFLKKRIGSGNPSVFDRGIVPRDTGKLRRSLLWSISRNYTIVPDASTKASDIMLIMWLFAQPEDDQGKHYARKLQFMLTDKPHCRDPRPAVAHPFPRCKRLNWSRKTGQLKYDPGAEPDFFKMLWQEGRRHAYRRYNSNPILANNFEFDKRDIKI